MAVNPVILGELRFAILILPTGKRRTALERWFDAGRLHCLAWDTDTRLIWAELLARLRKTGKTMPIKDSLIAATAIVHSLAVATRNRIDFAKAGVQVVIPLFLDACRVGHPHRDSVMTGASEAFVIDLGGYVREFTSLAICRLPSHRREVALHSVDTHRHAVHERKRLPHCLSDTDVNTLVRAIPSSAAAGSSR